MLGADSMLPHADLDQATVLVQNYIRLREEGRGIRQKVVEMERWSVAIQSQRSVERNKKIH